MPREFTACPTNGAGQHIREPKDAFQLLCAKRHTSGYLRNGGADCERIVVPAGNTVRRVACNISSSAPKALSTLLFDALSSLLDDVGTGQGSQQISLKTREARRLAMSEAGE